MRVIEVFSYRRCLPQTLRISNRQTHLSFNSESVELGLGDGGRFKNLSKHKSNKKFQNLKDMKN